jgi:hypothetical protein
MVFLARKILTKEVLFELEKMTKYLYVLFAFKKCLLTMTTFDFWTSMGCP